MHEDVQQLLDIIELRRYARAKALIEAPSEIEDEDKFKAYLHSQGVTDDMIDLVMANVEAATR